MIFPAIYLSSNLASNIFAIMLTKTYDSTETNKETLVCHGLITGKVNDQINNVEYNPRTAKVPFR